MRRLALRFFFLIERLKTKNVRACSVFVCQGPLFFTILG